MINDLEKKLGRDISTIRLQKDFTQEFLAKEAGISLSTLKNLERGRGSTIKTLLRVIQVLNKLSWLESLAPYISINPLHMVIGKPRKRANSLTRTKNRKRATSKHEGRRASTLKKYGLTVDQYVQMHKLQDGKCGNPKCGTSIDLDARTTHVDHDHKTGKVRNLLCSGCNSALGMIYENQDRAIGLAEYLKEHS